MNDHAPNVPPRSRVARRSVIWVTVVAVCFSFMAFGFYRIDDLKRRSLQITNGMQREQVEEILGEPYMSLKVQSDESAQMLIWIDNFWQVDVRVDGNDQVVMCRRMPAHSAFRRTQSRISSLLD